MKKSYAGQRGKNIYNKIKVKQNKNKNIKEVEIEKLKK